jgi:glyoxylate utilization-related uncharacterized protein
MKINKSGKSLSYFLDQKLSLVKDKMIKKIINTALKKKVDTRICLHKNPKKGFQFMLICKLNNTNEYFYQHKYLKFFYIIKGRIRLNLIKKKIYLGQNKNICYLMGKNIRSSTKSITSHALYLEVICKN